MASVVGRHDNGEEVTVDWGVADQMALDEADWYNSRGYPGVVFVAVAWVDGQRIELSREE